MNTVQTNNTVIYYHNTVSDPGNPKNMKLAKDQEIPLLLNETRDDSDNTNRSTTSYP